MKSVKQVIRVSVIAVTAVTLLISPPLNAVDSITDEQIANIRTHCTELQGSLTRLRQSDTLLRYNRGQLYLSIANKLMAPLNQRIASNQLDGSELVKLTAEYNQAYQDFFRSYRDYDTSLGDAQAISCTKQPTTFYDKISIARQNRINLHAANNQLVDLAKQYEAAFVLFMDRTLQPSTSASQEAPRE